MSQKSKNHGKASLGGSPKSSAPGAYEPQRLAEALPGLTQADYKRIARMSMDLEMFNGQFCELEKCLSSPRMSTYLEAAHGDWASAFRLYHWNTAVSSAFYGPLQWLEVTLRNSIDQCLADAYGHEWYSEERAGLDYICRHRLAKAREQLKRERKPVDPPHVVAALSFGFWVSLLGHGGFLSRGGSRANYEMSLWRPFLRKAFPNRKRLLRKEAHRPLNYLRTLRNRIAHHEAIFRRDLSRDYRSILEVTGWISPVARASIESYSRVPDLLDTLPAALHRF